VICVESGSGAAASSSSTRLTETTSNEPPVSDITVAFWPVGETSRMSMSSGKVCVSPLIDMLTSSVLPKSPETTQSEG